LAQPKSANGRAGLPSARGGANRGESRHICAFFRHIDEQYRVLRSLIEDGLDRGDRAFHLVDPQRGDEHCRRLTEAAIDVHAAITWPKSFQQVLETGPAAGYARTCCLGQRGWVQRDAADNEAWSEFESRLNAVLAGRRDEVICAYDLATISAAAVVDARRTHPAVILAGLLRENPFFLSPERFVAEIQERRSQGEPAPTGR
jgi:MEDS: MEthanogen/methylotroph, DcmR Sensory domain